MTICGICIMASVWDLGKYNASKGTSYIVLCLECEEQQRTGSETKRSDTLWSDGTPTFKSVTGGVRLNNQAFQYFP